MDTWAVFSGSGTGWTGGLTHRSGFKPNFVTPSLYILEKVRYPETVFSL